MSESYVYPWWHYKLEGETVRHIDDALDAKELPPFVHEFLEHARRPAMDKDYAWLGAHKPLVDWRGKTYWCCGASRLGDVWLREIDGGGNNSPYYDHRVDVAELSNWRTP